jgi:hypothetical protein
MIVLQSNDKTELQLDIKKTLKEFPGALCGPITKIRGGWFQVTILKPYVR